MAASTEVNISASEAPVIEAAAAVTADKVDANATHVIAATAMDETQEATSPLSDGKQGILPPPKDSATETPGTIASEGNVNKSKGEEEPHSFSKSGKEDLETMKENSEAPPAAPPMPDDLQEVPSPLPKVPQDVDALSPNGVTRKDADPKPDDGEQK